MDATIRSRILLSLAMLRELYNKITYYRVLINRNINRYSEYKERIKNGVPDKILDVDKEVNMLKTLDIHLNNISIFIERIILRLETLVVAGNSVTAALVVKDVVKVLRQYMKGVPPTLAILIDKLDEVSRSLIQELKAYYNIKTIDTIHSLEVTKIIDEAKKVAGLT